jgi:hypothetical protein
LGCAWGLALTIRGQEDALHGHEGSLPVAYPGDQAGQSPGLRVAQMVKTQVDRPRGRKAAFAKIGLGSRSLNGMGFSQMERAAC